MMHQMDSSTIADRIGRLPRLSLARLNTPFEEAPRLRAAIAETVDGGIDAVPRIFFKRDDATGFAFGGNKARHMEFLFADFIERGVDTIVNTNHYHSNQARFVAAASAKTGMRCHLVAVDMVESPVMGNLLLGQLTGAEIHRVPGEYARAVAERLVADENAAGRNATILSDNDFSDIAGMIGFVETGVELDAQTAAAGLGDAPLRFWGLVGRSIAGIRLYARNTGKPWSASATAYSHTQPAQYEAIYMDRSQRVAELLGLATALEPGDLDTVTGYQGTDYGVPHDGVFEAMELVASSEGVILDPNYTGKSMSALIGEIRAGRLDAEVPVVFVHSGGLPQVFAFADEIWGR